MLKCIVVPIEGGARDAEVVAMARRIALQLEEGIVLIHVAPILFDTEDVIAAEQHLDELARTLSAEGIETHFIMDYGEPAAAISDVARQQRAQMIVLAPENRALLEVLWHPRVSSRLVGQATTPLFILPDVPLDVESPALLGEPDAHVLVALDGSPLAEAALPLAVQLAQAYGRSLVLVRVVAPQFMIGAGVEAIKAQREAQYAEEAEAHHYLVEMRKRVTAETHLTVETIELVGPVAEQLTHLAASRPGSVLVMGTHGRTGLARVALGSVAAGALRHATTPLVIVPPHAAPDNADQP
jgi:nucleotide-binding universal stress UspA family protein